MLNPAQMNLLNNVIPDRNRHRRMAFYGRVSTEHEAQLSALQNQMQWYDDQLKYHSNWELVDRYIDEGITGTQAKKRPAFLQMIEDAKAGKFDLIVTREVCRFARNTVDTLIYTRELKNKYGIEVYFVEDNIWTMDGDGELRLTLMATLAQEESRKTSERVKAGQKISRDNGVLYGNGNIIGYDRVDGTYVINQEQAETVRIIYDLYLNGMGELKISRELSKLQRKDGRGNVKWSASKVNRILKNSTYKGVIAYGKSFSNNYLEQKRINNLDSSTYQYTTGDFPPIISPEDWDKVQKIRESKTIPATTDRRGYGKKKADDVWLRKLKCSCGSSFRKNKWRTNKNSGEDVFGYQCYNQVNNGSKSFREKNNLSTEGYCDIKMIADWKLDLMAKEVIGSIWQQRSESVISAYQMIIDCYKEEPSNVQKQIKELQANMQKTQTKIENLIEMRAEGEISRAEYDVMKTKLTAQVKSLRTEIDVLQQDNTTKATMEEKLKIIKNVLSDTIDFSKPKLPTYIIDRFVRQITPINNNLFKWYINLIDDNDESLHTEEIVIGTVGTRGKAMIMDAEGNTHLPSNQGSTGSYSQKIGESSTYQILIPFKNARAYRKNYGRYLRCNQWEDLIIEVCIII